jgi:hypothetical protein
MYDGCTHDAWDAASKGVAVVAAEHEYAVPCMSAAPCVSAAVATVPAA